jgi:hypothetical protein
MSAAKARLPGSPRLTLSSLQQKKNVKQYYALRWKKLFIFRTTFCLQIVSRDSDKSFVDWSSRRPCIPFLVSQSCNYDCRFPHCSLITSPPPSPFDPSIKSMTQSFSWTPWARRERHIFWGFSLSLLTGQGNPSEAQSWCDCRQKTSKQIISIYTTLRVIHGTCVRRSWAGIVFWHHLGRHTAALHS